MQRFVRHSRALSLAAIAAVAGSLVGAAAVPHRPHAAATLAVLMLSGVLGAFFDPAAGADERDLPPLSFIVDFASLLLFGPATTLLVAAAGTATYALTERPRAQAIRRLIANLAATSGATLAAGMTLSSLGGAREPVAWPWRGVPVAAAVVAYCLVKHAGIEMFGPLATRRAFNRVWPRRTLSRCPGYFICAAAGVALAEAIAHSAWEVLPAAAVPLFFLFRAYRAHVNRVAWDDRLHVIESLVQGMCEVDNDGRVTLWSESLARLVGCPRERALGGLLVEAVPALSKPEVRRAVERALRNQTAQTLPHLRLHSAASRTVQIKTLPHGDSVTLLWYDVTARSREEHALRRSAERFALAAAGANDGLWEWDLRSGEFYASARWWMMIGLEPREASGRLEDWFARVHPDDVALLKEALDAHLAGRTDHLEHEHRVRHEDGVYRRFLSRGVALRGNAPRAVRIAGSLTDITERAIAQERIRSVGFRDPLTGLCNRTMFVEGLGERLNDLKSGRAGRFAALYLDLDRFKVVNDSLGHLVGDELLIAVSRRLESCLRRGDALARLGGDEFAILLRGLDDAMQANVIAFRIQEALVAPFSIGGREVVTSASIGIAFSRPEYAHPEEIMRDADTAMYYAKTHGKARHELFDADMHARALDRLGLESDLRHAVKSQAFEVHYQPIVSLSTGMCAGFEALVRWQRNGKPVSPVQFIPVAEELGLIEAIGTWVLQEACRTFADWQRRFPDGGLECITVNVSARQLMQQGFVYLVEQTVQSAGLKPCDLRLEITETALMDRPHLAAQVLRDLRNFGVKIYLDDFGTGYSSLSHLHRLPVDALKIDRSFVKSLLLDDRPAIVESILALARTLHTSVVAEGVESDSQARELERLGCRQAQGFLFSPPLPAGSVEELLAAGQPLGDKRLRAVDTPTSPPDDSELRAS